MTWMCGAFQPANPPTRPYRCTRPEGHDGEHQADVDGRTVATWPRTDPTRKD